MNADKQSNVRAYIMYAQNSKDSETGWNFLWSNDDEECFMFQQPFLSFYFLSPSKQGVLGNIIKLQRKKNWFSRKIAEKSFYREFIVIIARHLNYNNMWHNYTLNNIIKTLWLYICKRYEYIWKRCESQRF